MQYWTAISVSAVETEDIIDPNISANSRHDPYHLLFISPTEMGGNMLSPRIITSQPLFMRTASAETDCVQISTQGICGTILKMGYSDI
jgi:hypothetical protein